jgi:anti-sigma regulatory factor (Ser/Thr protein kinase)
MTAVELYETVFPAVPESVGAARRFTRAALNRHSVDAELIQTATLLVSELATNAIIHAASTIQLRVGIGNEIRIEVCDSGDDEPIVAGGGPDDESGRGLAIVATLADTWDWSPKDPGKVVWFELERA